MSITLDKGMIGLIERNLVINGGKVITIPVVQDGVGTGIAIYCCMFDNVHPEADMKVLAEVVERLELRGK
jgi:hypothetical protein